MCDGARLDPQPLSLNVHHTSFMLKKSKNLKRFVASYPEQCFILVEEEICGCLKVYYWILKRLRIHTCTHKYNM